MNDITNYVIHDLKNSNALAEVVLKIMQTEWTMATDGYDTDEAVQQRLRNNCVAIACVVRAYMTEYTNTDIMHEGT
jgi:hypothetical protein